MHGHEGGEEDQQQDGDVMHDGGVQGGSQDEVGVPGSAQAVGLNYENA